MSLTDYFNQRRGKRSNQGVPFTDPITFVLGGKANNAPGYYKQDWNNWAPSVPLPGRRTFGNVRQILDEWQEP